MLFWFPEVNATPVLLGHMMLVWLGSCCSVLNLEWSVLFYFINGVLWDYKQLTFLFFFMLNLQRSKILNFNSSGFISNQMYSENDSHHIKAINRIPPFVLLMSIREIVLDRMALTNSQDFFFSLFGYDKIGITLLWKKNYKKIVVVVNWPSTFCSQEARSYLCQSHSKFKQMTFLHIFKIFVERLIFLLL